MTAVSQDLIRAILEVRDNRHNETHSALLAVWQAVVCELLDRRAISASGLVERLDAAFDATDQGPHGEAARTLIAHSADWLRRIAPETRLPPPDRWFAPKPDLDKG